MRLKQFRPRLNASFFCVSVNPFSEMIQHFIHTQNSHTCDQAIASSSPRLPPPRSSPLPHLQIHSWIPHHPSHPTFKDSCGGRGGGGGGGNSRWSFSMDLHYLQTGFSRNKNRCLPPSTRQKKPWKGGTFLSRRLPLERRTTRAGLFDVYTRHIRVLVIRKHIDSTRVIEDLIPQDALTIPRISCRGNNSTYFVSFCQNSICFIKIKGMPFIGKFCFVETIDNTAFKNS